MLGIRSLLLGVLSAWVVAGHNLRANNISTGYRIDVHSHVIPPVWREALIAAGYPVKNGTVYTDGFPVPDWTLESHLATMDTLGINFSTISVSAPGVYFLNDPKEAHALARTVNLAMHNYTQAHPTRLGALCLLPLPHFCLDTLKFPGVGTNANGTYLGNSTLGPVFSVLNERQATVFVHPAAPGCQSVSLGYPFPLTEYPFDSVRAMENLLLSGQRAKNPDVKMIFAHGGGAMPYLASRYYFDTASATSAIQLAAMKSFIGVEQILTGTDYPYVPLSQSEAALPAIQGNGEFTDAEMARMNHQNALSLFPRVAKVLGYWSSCSPAQYWNCLFVA
ncbi:amidohydrolase 2 [Aspergillus eucalypticola CBS 122712]|uniref:Amidohydrolase 2 n=1 Tax=Aspergillus eucalypticola (strain CBS 122712 / IBT 29274) TaxID=1448314 RepID=A0A317UTY8_ASPEC|nr:amidohydrolase 2 [Aspergillus eucalypticola CBS 122712]PWY64829.1 amidohydrolase 2 [Aspergillus eucalypticola CBS 122712]